MGLFSGNSSIEQAVDAATDGKKTAEDWQEILEIVDQIEQQPNGAKDAVKAIMKRVKNRDPHVGMLALTLLDACVANAKRKFHLEVSSRFFDDEVRAMFKNSNNYNRELLEKLAFLVKKWSENEFKLDPALTIIPSLWLHIKITKPNFVIEGKSPTVSAVSQQSSSIPKTDAAAILKKEEEEFAKAIALSLEEENKKKHSASHVASFPSSALYPSVTTNQNNQNGVYATVKKEQKEQKEPRKVRAMYDFEAVEDNELTFKAGEILHVIDDSDPNWWKGSNHRGEGLFPTNFVTSDLNWEAENEYGSSAKKKINDEVANLTCNEVVSDLKPVTINEALIDQTLNVIHDADPEGDRPDPTELLELEDQCSRMWPLIDGELQKTDKLQSALEEISTQINDALAMYDTVMKEQSAQMPTMAYPAVETQHGHYVPGVVGSQTPLQFVQQPGQFHTYSEQYPAGYSAPGPYAPPSGQGFQPYLPHGGKLAAAQQSQPQPQPLQQQYAQVAPLQQSIAPYSGQPQQGVYHNYTQQPPQ